MRALHVIQSYTVLNSVVETLHKTVYASDTWHNTTVSIGPKRPVSIADRWHYITCTLVTQPVLYARWHYTTCTSGRTTQPVRQITLHTFTSGHTAQPVRQVTDSTTYAPGATAVYTRSHPETCTLGATTAHVHRVALNSLYTRRHYTAVCQVTLHNLYARSHYTICTLDNIIHNLCARSHYTNTRHSFMLYNIAHSGTSG